MDVEFSPFVNLTRHADIYQVDSGTGTTTETKQTTHAAFPPEDLLNLPAGIFYEYHCRDSLAAEDPFYLQPRQ
jgi:hypothetical protein